MNEKLKALRIEQLESVAEVILLGPGKGNAMGPDFWKEMPVVFEQLGHDPSVRAVIVRGQGGNFSYGLDLMAAAGLIGPLIADSTKAGERLDLLDLVGQLQRAFDAIEACSKPVIAAVTGWCIGGGLDLVAACDLRLCTADTRFSLREAKVAMVADLGSLQRLPRIIGEGHTRELAFTGKNIDAARALRIGLVNDVYETEAALLDAARALARDIASNSPLVVRGIKEVLNASRGKTVAEGLRYVAMWNAAFLQSNDLSEAFGAFAARREPHFTGR
ncbi:MAG: crotonase/enoyl-CoA hydratase family protein [Myxococcales bacterium]|jgi:enoyl-CoA hydratase